MPCLLEAYDDTFKLCAAARRSRVPYTLDVPASSRRSALAAEEALKRRSLDATGGWKRRFFVLRAEAHILRAAEPTVGLAGRNASVTERFLRHWRASARCASARRTASSNWR